MKHTFILTLLLILTSTACQHRAPITSVFAEAESLMYTHPDSALKLLQAIPNPERLPGKEQADYALLLTQAKSRNQIYATSDSLIRIAVDYYQNSDEMGQNVGTKQCPQASHTIRHTGFGVLSPAFTIPTYL